MESVRFDSLGTSSPQIGSEACVCTCTYGSLTVAFTYHNEIASDVSACTNINSVSAIIWGVLSNPVIPGH